MREQIKAEWIAALKSGEYQQATGRLRTADGYCCLGVLCELYRLRHSETSYWETSQDGTIGDFVSENNEGEKIYADSTLPSTVANWAGISGDDPVLYGRGITANKQATAADWNDGSNVPIKASFKQIADMIEVSL